MANRETYADWKNVPGFGLVGDTSFFPHMDDRWLSLVEEKKSDLNDASIVCLRDEEACCIDGQKKKQTVLASSLALA